MAGNQKGWVLDAGEPAGLLHLLHVGPERALPTAGLDRSIAYRFIQAQISSNSRFDVVVERCINHSRALYALKILNDWGVPTVNRYEVAETQQKDQQAWQQTWNQKTEAELEGLGDRVAALEKELADSLAEQPDGGLKQALLKLGRGVLASNR